MCYHEIKKSILINDEMKHLCITKCSVVGLRKEKSLSTSYSSVKYVSTLFQLFDRNFSEYMITMYGVLVLTVC